MPYETECDRVLTFMDKWTVPNQHFSVKSLKENDEFVDISEDVLLKIANILRNDKYTVALMVRDVMDKMTPFRLNENKNWESYVARKNKIDLEIDLLKSQKETNISQKQTNDNVRTTNKTIKILTYIIAGATIVQASVALYDAKENNKKAKFKEKELKESKEKIQELLRHIQSQKSEISYQDGQIDSLRRKLDSLTH